MKEHYSGNPVAMKIAAWRLNHPTSGSDEAISDLAGISKEEIRSQWNAIDVLYESAGGSHFHFLKPPTEQTVTALFKEHGL